MYIFRIGFRASNDALKSIVRLALFRDDTTLRQPAARMEDRERTRYNVRKQEV